MYPEHVEELKSQIAVMRLTKNKETKQFREAGRMVIRRLDPRHRMMLKKLNLIGPRPIADDPETYNNLIMLGLAVKVVWRTQLTHVAATELGYDSLMSFAADRQVKIVTGTNS
jgi:hypothetical protein